MFWINTWINRYLSPLRKGTISSAPRNHEAMCLMDSQERRKAKETLLSAELSLAHVWTAVYHHSTLLQLQNQMSVFQCCARCVRGSHLSEVLRTTTGLHRTGQLTAPYQEQPPRPCFINLRDSQLTDRFIQGYSVWIYAKKY